MKRMRRNRSEVTSIAEYSELGAVRRVGAFQKDVRICSMRWVTVDGAHCDVRCELGVNAEKCYSCTKIEP